MMFRQMENMGRFAIIGFLLLAACAQDVVPPIERNYLAPGDRLQRSLRVAVVPFDNLTNHPNAGLIAAQLLSSELYSQRVFHLSEEGKVRRAVAAQRDGLEVDAPLDAQKLGRALKVDAVLTGSVSEYGYKHSLKEEPAVGLNLRLISRQDGDVLWAASHSEVGGDKRRESLNQMAQRIVERMISALVDAQATAQE